MECGEIKRLHLVEMGLGNGPDIVGRGRTSSSHISIGVDLFERWLDSLFHHLTGHFDDYDLIEARWRCKASL